MKSKLLPAVAMLFALALPHKIMSQWNQTGGPPGMSINTFYDAGTSLFAGTSSKGVFISKDNGVRWRPANEGLENLQVLALTGDGKLLYAGTNEGVFISANQGTSWIAANAGIENKTVITFLIANGYIYAGSLGQGLYKSSDHGRTWTDANGGLFAISTIHAITYSNGNLVVAADDQIFYSRDNGASWNFDFSSPFIFGLTGFVTKGDSVMVYDGDKVNRSFDGGVRWGRSVTISPTAIISGMFMENNTVFAGGRTGVFWSSDFGSSWKAIPNRGLKIGAIGTQQTVDFNNTFSRSGKNFLLGYEEVGVAYSLDTGKNWAYTVDGFPPASTIDNALFAADTIIYSGTHGDGLYQSTTDGKNWIKITRGDNLDSLANSNVFTVLKTGNILLAGTCSYGLFRSDDNGRTWTRIHNGLPADKFGLLCVNGLAQTATTILAATSKGLYYSTDVGKSWNPTALTGDNLSADGVAANGSVAIAAVAHFEGTNNLYRSEDNGITWTSVLALIDDFTCAASDGIKSFYIGTFTGGFRSLDNGRLWSSFGNGIPPGTGAFTIATKGKNVFVGNSNGIFYSSNQAASFIRKSEGLDSGESGSVQGLAVNGPYLYAGTFRSAVWRRPLSQFSTVAPEIKEKTDELTFTIAPNPANAGTTISYYLTQPAAVSITLYNSTGTKIKTVENAMMQTGSHELMIGTQNLSAGLYFLKIIIGGRAGVRKLIVTK